ncbi:MAG: ATP-binding protein [Aliidongia sp.]
MKLEAFVDGDFDGVARDGRRSTTPRVLSIAIFVALFMFNFGLVAGGLWLVGAIASEVWTRQTIREKDDGCRAGLGARLNLLGGMASSALLWSSMAAIYWASGSEPLRIVAILLLTSMLVLAQGYSFKVRGAGIAFGIPAIVPLVIAPVLFGGYSGTGLLMVGMGVVLSASHVAVGTRLNSDAGAALRMTQADLYRQREAAEAASRAKTSFLAIMSHELRTPMNGVLGMARALEQTDLDARQRDYISMLIRSGDGLMTILNDVLDISKIEAGKLELEEAPFDLREIGQGVYDLWSEMANTKGIQFTYTFDPAAPHWVVGDDTRVRQIILNLVGNAVKFTRQGEVCLAIRAVAGRIEISVSDTGPGISREQGAKLFQLFTQADVSTTRKFGGTGLGLYICRTLAETMGGEISLKSRVGQGSRFIASLPLVIAGARIKTEDIRAETSLSGLRILVADDNSINRAVAGAILERAHAEVVTAEDGAEALAQLRAVHCDLVLMDIHMPKMDGIEALGRIRAAEAGPPDIPVIALTADAMSGVDQRLLALGFDGVQFKPIDNAGLLTAIATLCRNTHHETSRTKTA